LGRAQAEPEARFDEQVITGEITEDGSQQRGTITAEPDRHGDRAEHRHEPLLPPKYGIEQPSKQHRRHGRQHREDVGS